MNFRSLLRFQLLYAALGILFNVASIWHMSSNGSYLNPNDPYLGLIVMSIYGLFVYSGKMGFHLLYRILMLIAIVLIGYGGVIQHIINVIQGSGHYHSILVGLIGFSINLFGLLLNIIAVTGRYS